MLAQRVDWDWEPYLHTIFGVVYEHGNVGGLTLHSTMPFNTIFKSLFVVFSVFKWKVFKNIYDWHIDWKTSYHTGVEFITSPKKLQSRILKNNITPRKKAIASIQNINQSRMEKHQPIPWCLKMKDISKKLSHRRVSVSTTGMSETSVCSPSPRSTSRVSGQKPPMVTGQAMASSASPLNDRRLWVFESSGTACEFFRILFRCNCIGEDYFMRETPTW